MVQCKCVPVHMWSCANMSCANMVLCANVYECECCPLLIFWPAPPAAPSSNYCWPAFGAMASIEEYNWYLVCHYSLGRTNYLLYYIISGILFYSSTRSAALPKPFPLHQYLKVGTLHVRAYVSTTAYMDPAGII